MSNHLQYRASIVGFRFTDIVFLRRTSAGPTNHSTRDYPHTTGQLHSNSLPIFRTSIPPRRLDLPFAIELPWRPQWHPSSHRYSYAPRRGLSGGQRVPSSNYGLSRLLP